MTELELMLQAAGAAADWPPTPNLAPAVQLRIAPAPPRRARRRQLLVAFAALVIAAGAGAAVLERSDEPAKRQAPAHLRFGPHSRDIIITQLEGRLIPEFLFKFAGPGAKIENLRIRGERAVWIQGEARQFAYRDALGELRTGGVQPSGPVLLWQHGRRLVEIAGARRRARALAIARAARAVP